MAILRTLNSVFRSICLNSNVFAISYILLHQHCDTYNARRYTPCGNQAACISTIRYNSNSNNNSNIIPPNASAAAAAEYDDDESMTMRCSVELMSVA